MKRIYTWTLIGFLAAGAGAAHAGASVPYAQDLAADAREAQRRAVPILVMFNASSCPYCELVMEDYIKPMLKDPAYRDQVIIRVVSVGTARPMIDFSGRRVGHEAFAADRGVTLTPVVKFFGADGKELTDELLGFTNEHFYGWYLDEAIATSRSRMRQLLGRAGADTGL
jgi:thioredoxin-related protein